MARPRKNTVVQMPPKVKGFMPMGYYGDATDAVILSVDEYESIKLLDYEGLQQEEAAEYMRVSRPTLTRIYLRARKKMAKALTEARQLLIEGGNAIFKGEWFLCNTCICKFNNPKLVKIESCPLCEGINIHKMEVEK